MKGEDLDRLAVEIGNRLMKTPRIIGGSRNKAEIGERVQLYNALLNVSSGFIHIGDDSFCGHNVCLLTGSHPLEGERQRVFPDGHDIRIGKNVWLASNVTVIGPCTIGDDCVIAAGAVVTKDCEAGWIYGGVPAKKIRRANGHSEPDYPPAER